MKYHWPIPSATTSTLPASKFTTTTTISFPRGSGSWSWRTRPSKTPSTAGHTLRPPQVPLPRLARQTSSAPATPSRRPRASEMAMTVTSTLRASASMSKNTRGDHCQRMTSKIPFLHTLPSIAGMKFCPCWAVIAESARIWLRMWLIRAQTTWSTASPPRKKTCTRLHITMGTGGRTRNKPMVTGTLLKREDSSARLVLSTEEKKHEKHQ